MIMRNKTRPMSLSQLMSKNLMKNVDEIIHTFIQQVSDKFNLDADELLAEWEGGSNTKPGTSTAKPAKAAKSSITDIPSATDELDPAEILAYKKPELQALCRQRGLKTTGTKQELIDSLLGGVSTTATKPAITKKTEAKLEPKPAPKSVAKAPAKTPVAAKLSSQVPSIKIARNQFGNFEDPETGFVFNKKTTEVIGRQNDDGTVDDLTDEDIEICKQYKFSYVLPGNLDKKSRLNDVKVEELDEDLEDEEIIVSDEEDGEIEDEAILDEEELLVDEDEEDEDEDDDDEEDFEEDYE